MKVLQLCNKPPFPPVDGGTIGMNSVTQGLLSAGCEVKVLSAYSYKHPIQYSKITEEYKNQTQFEAVYFHLKLNPFHALSCLITGKSYHISRFINKAFEKKLIEILQKATFDVVHIDSIFLAPYVEFVRKYSSAKVVLRAHNVEFLIWERIAKNTKNPLKRWYLNHLSYTLKKYEIEQSNKCDGVVCVSEYDTSVFKKEGVRVAMIPIPFVLTNPEVAENVAIERNSLFHIGSMDWIPNMEGISWFLKDIWPLVTAQLPQVTLYLAGRKMPKSIFKYTSLYSNVRIVGEIHDAAYFIASKELNIVPLLSGSGFRIKIIEAMSLGKVVITTSLGAEGIPYTDGVDILIAHTPEEFVTQIEKCVQDKTLCQKIGENAHQLILDIYNIDHLTQKLIQFYRSL